MTTFVIDTAQRAATPQHDCGKWTYRCEAERAPEVRAAFEALGFTPHENAEPTGTCWDGRPTTEACGEPTREDVWFGVWCRCERGIPGVDRGSEFLMKPMSTSLERIWFPDWLPGQRAWFEYHCWESPESNDAPAWYHSHQQVTVLAREVNDGAGMSWIDRMESGCPYTYTVRFDDGLVWGAFEDELTADRTNWYCADPPQPPHPHDT